MSIIGVNIDAGSPVRKEEIRLDWPPICDDCDSCGAEARDAAREGLLRVALFGVD